MSLVDFWRLLSQVSFLFVSVTTLYQWIRHRDQTRLDIALVFLLFSVAILGQYYRTITQDTNQWLALGFSVAILAQPFFLLRIVRYFHPLPSLILWLAFGTFVAASVILAVTLLSLAPGTPTPRSTAIPLVAYLVVVGGYASFLFVRGAVTIPGVTGKRLFLVSLGSGLLALLFLGALVLSLLGATQLPEPAQSLVGVALQSLAIASAASYYLGFSPPRGLIRSWQLRELQRFLQLAPKKPSLAESSTLLASSAQRAVGGASALVLLWDTRKGGLRAAAPEDAVGQHWDWKEEPLLVEVLHKRRPRASFVGLSAPGLQTAPWVRKVGARTCYVLPLESSLHRWGVFLVALRYSPLFVQDDLDLLTLLGEQCALQLDAAALVDSLAQVNDALKERVAEQSRQALLLEEANKELEAFSYSVSHDLRSPLRGIDGWSSALQEDYGHELDETAQDYLKRVRSEARRMSQLIDDLFQLSRVSRTELVLDVVDLSRVASKVAGRLKESLPERNIEFVIQPELNAFCDSRLIDVVLTNLFDNAAKFTAPRNPAVVEFGQTESGAFFVRDNGVGYDMRYADKLFGVFQRMHDMASFPGTGIGLAIVKRVIQRQGGRVWAEGKLGEGATFYFTLKETP